MDLLGSELSLTLLGQDSLSCLATNPPAYISFWRGRRIYLVPTDARSLVILAIQFCHRAVIGEGARY